MVVIVAASVTEIRGLNAECPADQVLEAPPQFHLEDSPVGLAAESDPADGDNVALVIGDDGRMRPGRG